MSSSCRQAVEVPERDIHPPAQAGVIGHAEDALRPKGLRVDEDHLPRKRSIAFVGDGRLQTLQPGQLTGEITFVLGLGGPALATSGTPHWDTWHPGGRCCCLPYPAPPTSGLLDSWTPQRAQLRPPRPRPPSTHCSSGTSSGPSCRTPPIPRLALQQSGGRQG